MFEDYIYYPGKREPQHTLIFENIGEWVTSVWPVSGSGSEYQFLKPVP